LLESLITSQTRIKLLLKFFLNSSQTAYLRGLSTEFNESTNAIRLELNRFEKAGLISSTHEGNKKLFKANLRYPLFKDIHNILLKHTGIDKIINDVVKKLGNVQRAWLTGDFAAGKNSQTIEIVLTGENIDTDYLQNLKNKAEKIIKKTILTKIIATAEEKEYLKTETPTLLIWEA